MSHDTFKIRLKFPRRDWTSGLWVGGHFAFHAKTEGETLCRKYTPVSPIYKKGYVDFVIKEYQPNDEYPEGGKMSRYITSRKLGDTIMVEGPMGALKYHGYGTFEKAKKKFNKKKLYLLCAGTGLTPHLSIAFASLRAKDGLDITMLYTNKTKDDILCKGELDYLDSNFNTHFTLFYTLTRHDASNGPWDGFNCLLGRPDANMLKNIVGLSQNSDDVFVCICGPKSFNVSMVKIL